MSAAIRGGMLRSMEAEIVVETDRLAIRWWRKGDEEALFRIFGDPAVHRYSGTVPYEDVDPARAWLERELDLAPARGFDHWAVVEKASLAVIGSCGFRVGFRPGELELGFTIAQPYWGRRYATEAAACLRVGFERLGATQILSLTMPENARARRLLQRLGFHLRGVERHDGIDGCVYELPRARSRSNAG